MPEITDKTFMSASVDLEQLFEIPAGDDGLLNEKVRRIDWLTRYVMEILKQPGREPDSPIVLRTRAVLDRVRQS